MARSSIAARIAAVPVTVLAAAVLALGQGLPAVLAADAGVRIGDALEPARLEITPGTTVTWTNDHGDRHRMRSTSGPDEFDSGDLEPSDRFSFTFTVEGTYQYRDERNKELSNYWGTIVVARQATPTPAPTAPPGPGATPRPTPAPTSPPAGDITMAGRVFRPATLTVDAGTVVRWRNDDGRDHTVTANDRSFDSGIMGSGATFSRVFNTPGTFGYLCLLHPDMTGTIAVRGTGGATPPPAPDPTPTPRPTPAPTPPPGSSAVRVVDFAFDPPAIDVIAGTTITWLNEGAALHTVTASDGTFDSGLMAAGARFSRRFPTPGTYPYLCALHPSMTGVVRVSGSGGATPPPAASPAPTPRPPTPGSGELELRDFAFVPSSIRVSPGTTVTWLNTGAAPHTVTDRAGSFDSGMIARGARWSRTFAVPGTFNLLCSIHPDMTATLVVAAPGATAPPPATPPPVATPPPGSDEVAALDFSFAPQVLRVAVGTTVRWTNAGVAPHTVTAKDGSFDSGFLNTGETYSRTFSEEGLVEYLCAIHPAMIGTVVVGAATDAGGAPGAAASSPPDAVSSPPGGAVGAGGGSPGDTGSSTAGQPPGSGPANGGLAAASGPPTVESMLRVGLALLLSGTAIVVFAGIVRATVRTG